MPSSDIYQVKIVDAGAISVAIAAGTTTSTVLNCQGASAMAIETPAAFDACNLTFSVSLTGDVGTFRNLRDPSGNGNLYTITVAANDHLPIDPIAFAGARYIQVICSVTQSNARTINFVMGPLWQ